MNLPVTNLDFLPSTNLRVARRLTFVVLLLAAVAAGAGLFLPALYRETAWTLPQVRGQDLVTLLVLPVLAAAMPGVKRGQARATMVWIGLLGYLFYTYTGAAFSYAFNELFPIYVALFSLSVATLIAAGTGIDVAGLQRRFDAATPRRAVATFLSLLALLLIVLWLGQIVPFFTTGTLPELITRAETPTCFVYVLDLGVVVPVSMLSAVWLWRRSPWGYVLAGCVLIKATTMGLALLSMTWFSMRAGQPFDPGLTAVWVLIASSGLGMSIWFLRHCRG